MVLLVVDMTNGQPPTPCADGFDVFVHCVGMNLRQPVLDFTDAQWDEILA